MPPEARGDETPERGAPRIRDLPDARERLAELTGRPLAVFLDYDGTLTPIVPDPDRALLSGAARRAVERLRDRWPVAVVSGRDLEDVRAKVGIDAIAYAGSHGFEVLTPDGRRELRGEEFLGDLDAAETDLRRAVTAHPGAEVERKRVALAIHFRGMSEGDVPALRADVEQVAARYPRLRVSGGKRIFELRPNLEWHKGKALLWFLDVLGLDDPALVPIYIGDDVTDEDAFRSLGERGVGIVVRGEDDDRPTAARLSLANPGDVRTFLEALAAS